MSEIIKLKNPFRRNERQIISIVGGQTIYDIRRHPDVVKDLGLDIDVDISINGISIPKEKWLTRRVKQNEFLFILPKVAGGDDGKSILNIVLMIAVMYYAPGAAQSLWGGTSTITIGGAGVYLTSVAIMVGGAMIISALTPHPKLPSSGFIDDEESQVFGWNPATIQRQGIPVPRFYGLNKLYGNVIAAHTEKEAVTYEETTIDEAYYYEKGRWKGLVEGYRQVQVLVEFDPRKVNLYALFSLGIGPIREPVVDGTLKLNNQKVENFDNIYYDTKRGNLRQSASSYFNQTKLEVVVNRLVEYGNPVIYETSNGNFNDLEVELSFPGGLYDGSGADLANNTVNVTVEVKKTTASTWIKLADNVALTDNVGNKVIQNYPTSGVISIDYGSNYQIRVTKETAERDNIRYGDLLYLDKVREVIDIVFTHPRRALVGIKALATNQLSGSIRFSCYSRGLYVVDIRDSASSIIYSNNPADVIYDILTQPVFSGEHSPWLDLKLILNFNGTDEATSTVDDSIKGHVINFTGTAQLDTAQKKFGTASLLLDGNSDDVNIADSNDWDIFENIFNDWTLDIEVRFADHVGTEILISHYEDSNNLWYLAHIHGTGLVLKNRIGGVDKVLISVIAGEITDTNFHHIAVCKVGADIGLYLDGIQVGYDLMVAGDSDTYDGSLFIGQQGNDTSWSQCHFDHIRIFKQNIFDASPVTGNTDTIIEPVVEYTDPGNSYAVERYDGYNPSKLNDADFEDLADWCDDAKVNPINFVIDSISKATNAVIVTRSNHNFKISDMILFRNIDDSDMIEILDGATATVLKITDDTTFTIDLDTSGYTTFNNADKLLYNFEGDDGDTTTADESPQGHDLGAVEFESNSQIDIAQKKFGDSSLLLDGDNDRLALSSSPDFRVFSNLTDDWTISVFWRGTSIGGTDCIIELFESDVGGDNKWKLTVGSVGGGTISFLNFVAGGGKVQIIAAPGLSVDTWYHIAVVKKGDLFGLYLDGVQIAFDTMVGGDVYEYDGALYIGSDEGLDEDVDGHIDGLYITNKNYFSVTPNVGLTSTITVPTTAHSVSFPTIEVYQPRFTFNGGFDTESNMWDAALRVSELCRCIPYWNGDKIYIAIDKLADSVYAFTMGNILKDSYSEVWIPKAERASEIEIHYRNAQKDYKRQPFLLINPDAGNVTKKVRLDLFGITDVDMANRIAEHRLLQNQYIKKMTKWTSDVEAIPCIIGDVVEVQNDITNYGQMGSGDDDITGGGRVIAVV